MEPREAHEYQSLHRDATCLTASLPRQAEWHCFARLVFLYMFGSNVLYAKWVSSMAAHAACGRSPLSAPRWCWMQTSHGGGRVLLTWSCSHGNTAGSAGLCIQPVCRSDSEDCFPVITGTHSSVSPSEIILKDFRNSAVVDWRYRYVFVFSSVGTRKDKAVKYYQFKLHPESGEGEHPQDGWFAGLILIISISYVK